MKHVSLLLLVLVFACSKHSSSSKNSSGPNPVNDPRPIVDIADPLNSGNTQEQTDGPFELERNYNGENVVLNHNSSRHLGMIRIKGKDAEKLHKHLALTTIRLNSEKLNGDLEAKVGKHVMCRADNCWIYIDYKNGVVTENIKTSEFDKAPRIILPYNGDNLELRMFGRKGKIKVEGMDAKALYSVMEVPEERIGGKSSESNKKEGHGDGIECKHIVSDKAGEQDKYSCEVNFNHRSGAMKDSQE